MIISKDEKWCFIDSPNVAVITTNAILSKEQQILYVSHDDDGMWQFHSNVEISDKSAKVVALSSIVKLDASVNELCELPLGWQAIRKNYCSHWQVFKKTENELY